VVGEQDVRVAVDRLLLAVEPQLLRVLLVRLGGVVEAEEFVKAVVHRVDVRLGRRAWAAVVPLPEHARDVAALLQRLGDRHLRRRQILVVRADAAMDGVTPGHQGRAARRARDAGGVPATKDRPLRGKAVEVRRRPFLASVEPDVAPPQVVGQNQHDVCGAPVLCE
jgi:hypothetical protein